MELDAVLLVQRAHEIAELRPEHAFERALLRRHHMHLDLARAQRGGDLQPDEARADHHRALGLLRLRDDGAAVGERAQRVHVRQIGARERQLHRLGAGRQQQRVEGQRRAVAERQLLGARIECGHLGLEPERDVVFRVPVVAAQRHPVLRRAAGQIVLRQVGAIDGRSIVIAQHGDAAGKTAPPQHLGSGKAGRPAADNDDALGGWSSLFRRRLLFLARDDDFAAALFDTPTIERA